MAVLMVISSAPIKASKGEMHGSQCFFEASAILKHTSPAKAGGAERVPPVPGTMFCAGADFRPFDHYIITYFRGIFPVCLLSFPLRKKQYLFSTPFTKTRSVLRLRGLHRGTDALPCVKARLFGVPRIPHHVTARDASRLGRPRKMRQICLAGKLADQI